MGTKLENGKISEDCKKHFKSINDTMYILSGKWRPIIMASLASGKKHYLEIQRIVEGIGSKMLSKELQELEMNGLVTRKVLNTKPVSVEYELTNYALTLKPIMDSMAEWGKEHKEKLIEEMKSPKINM